MFADEVRPQQECGQDVLRLKWCVREALELTTVGNENLCEGESTRA